MCFGGFLTLFFLAYYNPEWSYKENEVHASGIQNAFPEVAYVYCRLLPGT